MSLLFRSPVLKAKGSCCVCCFKSLLRDKKPRGFGIFSLVAVEPGSGTDSGTRAWDSEPQRRPLVYQADIVQIRALYFGV